MGLATATRWAYSGRTARGIPGLYPKYSGHLRSRHSTLEQLRLFDSKSSIEPREVFLDPGTPAREFITTAKLLPLFLVCDPQAPSDQGSCTHH